MTEASDAQLLRDYVEHGHEAAVRCRGRRLLIGQRVLVVGHALCVREIPASRPHCHHAEAEHLPEQRGRPGRNQITGIIRGILWQADIAPEVEPLNDFAPLPAAVSPAQTFLNRPMPGTI